jgi:hypothetical protein
MSDTIDAWMFFAFRVTCGFAGLALALIVVAALALWAIERTLCVAAIVEAANEARKQGRAPILKAWLRRDSWGGEMTDTTELIQRLREHRGDYAEEMDEAADALEQQAAQIAEKDAEIARLRGIVPEVLEKLNDELCAENEALRADAERWSHVRDGFSVMGLNIDGMHSWTWRGYHKIGKGANIDEAVDAALRQEQPT